jgi:hypothetical protein
MQDTKFWRIIAVVVCVGILYVGHGLHNRGSDGLPSLTNVARAGGVAIASPKEGDRIYTTGATGTVLHIWTIDISGKPKYIGTVQTDGTFSQNRKAEDLRSNDPPAQKQ